MMNIQIKNNKGSRFIKMYSACLKRHINKRCAPVDGNPEYSRGFTLVETMVAVMILTLTIVSMMTVVANSLFAARYARDEITAGYLLQEVVDFIKNDRDTTVFLQNATGVDATAAWGLFVLKYANCTTAKGGCYFDVLVGNTPAVCTLSSGCRDLYFNANAGTASFYINDNSGNNGYIKSGYQRKIIVDTVGDSVLVTATVYWKNGGLAKSRSLTNTLMKWQLY